MDEDYKGDPNLESERVLAAKGPRKKFTKPPVKVACLSCRASRIRCDGKDPCSSCTAKAKECSYMPSRRGGPRKKKIMPMMGTAVEPPNCKAWNAVHPPRLDEDFFNRVDTLAVPGAGLRSLDFPSEVQSMFEGLFVPQSTASYPNLVSDAVPVLPPPPQIPTRVRVYGSEEEILNAYYTFIHNYFPIFAPYHTPPGADSPLDYPAGANLTPDDPRLVYFPRSPVTLAISAILARIPHPTDPNPSSSESVLLRRAYSHKLACMALESVEAESELLESCASPAQALQKERPMAKRTPVHPHTPLELEAILALLLLSIYEYTQRGNLAKMRKRAGEAYVMATGMSLHTLGAETEVFSEAKRRAWWMTFYCICQGSIVSTTTAMILVTDTRFVTPLPHFAADSEAWSILIQAQQVLTSATQYIIDLNRALRGRADLTQIYEKVKKLDAWAFAGISRANTPPTQNSPILHAYRSESVTANSIRSIARIKFCSARIKLNRFRAFLDIPIFIKKHCDLTCASIGSPDVDRSGSESYQSPTQLSCCATNLSQIRDSSEISPSASVSPPASDTSSFSWVSEDAFPFSNYESTVTCLESALTIAQMFHDLPYPKPSYSHSRYAGIRPSCDPMPRTMPSFACCAMQSSYAMLMLYYKSRVTTPEQEENPLRNRDHLGEKLQQGLQYVIEAVKNYAIAFEALDGMRDEIEGAYMTAFPQS